MNSDILTTAGISSTLVISVLILYRLYHAINHKRIRSNCCGKKLVASIDIEETTPPHEEKVIENPMRPYLNTRPFVGTSK